MNNTYQEKLLQGATLARDILENKTGNKIAREFITPSFLGFDGVLSLRENAMPYKKRENGKEDCSKRKRLEELE